MGLHTRRTAALAAAGAALLGAGPGLAQQGEQTAAPRFVLNYAAELEADTNEDLVADSPGTSLDFNHTLGLRYLAETQLQSLSFNSFATAQLGYDPELDDTVSEFSQGGLNLDYTRRGSRSELTFGANYRENEVEANELVFLDTDGDAVIDEAGLSRRDATVTTLGVSTSLQTGIDRPLSTTYRFDARDRSYSDNDDPDLYDNRSVGIGLTTSLRFNPVLTGRVVADYRRYDHEDIEETEGEERSLRLGATYAVNPTLEVDGTLGYSEDIEEVTTLDGDRVEEATDGIVASLGFTQDRPLGAIFGEYTRDVNDDGIRDSVSIGRSLAFPGSELSGSIGVTSLEGGELNTLFRVTYARDLPDGGLSARIERRVTTNTLDEERILTLATVDYSRQLTALTSMNIGLDVARIAETEADDGDDERTEVGLTASFNRPLTRDWSLGMGYRGRYEELEDGGDAVANAVFVTVGRDFVIRP